MEQKGNNRRILFAKSVTMAAVAPLMIWGFAGGPDPGKTGAPGDQTCAQATCHTGNPVTNGGIQLQGQNGTYTPAQKQRWTVVVDGATGPVYGFQGTARLASNERTAQAGAFSAVDATTFVLCQDGREKTATVACRAEAPIEFIEHRMARSQNSYTFEWTPPATDQGNVRVYIAGNVANGNGQNTGDRIFLANFTLTPQAGQPPPPPAPQIRSEQPVLQAFSNSQMMSAGTWIQIFGANLSATTREWRLGEGGDFNGDRAPTSLDGVRVNVDGRPAFVSYISPTQLNAQVPDGIGVGSAVPVEVVNAAGSSTQRVNAARVSPALLTTPAFNVGGRQYLAAVHTDLTTFVGRTGLIAGVPFRPARPGDRVIIYAVGCGPTTPAQPAGVIVREIRNLSSSVQVRFGQTMADSQAFLSPPFIGLCRIDTTVPNVADGDTALEVTIDGVPSGQNLFTNIQR